MGKGKGKIKNYACKILAGNIFLEICGKNKKKIIMLLLRISKQLPIRTKIFFLLNSIKRYYVL